jgi:hypothetical protein
VTDSPNRPQVFIKSELKVGVIYVKEGQYAEEEILSNNRESDHFTEFLSILGEKVRLKGQHAKLNHRMHLPTPPPSKCGI